VSNKLAVGDSIRQKLFGARINSNIFRNPVFG